MPTRLLLLRVFRFASSTASTMASSFLSCSLDSCSMNNFVRPDTRTCRVLRSQIERTWACWVKKPWRNFAVDFSEQTWHTFEGSWRIATDDTRHLLLPYLSRCGNRECAGYVFTCFTCLRGAAMRQFLDVPGHVEEEIRQGPWCERGGL